MRCLEISTPDHSAYVSAVRSVALYMAFFNSGEHGRSPIKLNDLAKRLCIALLHLNTPRHCRECAEGLVFQAFETEFCETYSVFAATSEGKRLESWYFEVVFSDGSDADRLVSPVGVLAAELGKRHSDLIAARFRKTAYEMSVGYDRHKRLRPNHDS